jgi:hypothetical protein
MQIEVMNKIKTAFLVCSCFALFGLDLYAGPPGPPMGGGNPHPPCWPHCPIPIDGGLSFLIAAGAGLAGKKLYDLKKRNKP